MSSRLFGAVAQFEPFLFARTTSGLVFEDDFDRANSATVGNGWVEYEPVDPLSIAGNLLAVGGGSSDPSKIERSSPTPPVSLIIQAVVRSQDGSGIIGVYARSDLDDNGAESEYRFYVDRPNNGISLVERNEGVNGSTDLNTNTNPSSNWKALRMVIQDGATTTVDGYMSETLDDENDTSFTINTESVQIVDTTPVSNGLTGYGILGAWNAQANNFLVCGRNVVVNDLPTGWKARIDGGASVTEAGGTATVNVDTVSLPATTLEILDDQNRVRQTASPVGGIFGGDIFEDTFEDPSNEIHEIDTTLVYADGADSSDPPVGGDVYQMVLVTQPIDADEPGLDGWVTMVAQTIEQLTGAEVTVGVLADGADVNAPSDEIARTKVTGDDVITEYPFREPATQFQLVITVSGFTNEVELGKADVWSIGRRDGRRDRNREDRLR